MTSTQPVGRAGSTLNPFLPDAKLLHFATGTAAPLVIADPAVKMGRHAAAGGMGGEVERSTSDKLPIADDIPNELSKCKNRGGHYFFSLSRILSLMAQYSAHATVTEDAARTTVSSPSQSFGIILAKGFAERAREKVSRAR